MELVLSRQDLQPGLRRKSLSDINFDDFSARVRVVIAAAGGAVFRTGLISKQICVPVKKECRERA